jgi:hypothetical protein
MPSRVVHKFIGLASDIPRDDEDRFRAAVTELMADEEVSFAEIRAGLDLFSLERLAKGHVALIGELAEIRGDVAAMVLSEARGGGLTAQTSIDADRVLERTAQLIAEIRQGWSAFEPGSQVM